jgi:hypothetical protein
LGRDHAEQDVAGGQIGHISGGGDAFAQVDAGQEGGVLAGLGYGY